MAGQATKLCFVACPVMTTFLVCVVVEIYRPSCASKGAKRVFSVMPGTSPA